MKGTAAVQVNLDYRNEEDAMAKLRVVLGLTSIVTAIFANSSFSEGRLNGFCCRRLHIWNHTDPERSGLVMRLIRPDLRFSDYLDYILDLPLIFIVRNGRWIPVKRLTFREFIRQGYEGAGATLSDFELHLSTAFPEARLKQYLEVRGADCQSPDLTPAVAAFWKGILYDVKAREEAWKLVAFASESERLGLHEDVERHGLKAHLGEKPILPIARDLLEIASAGLSSQAKRSGSEDEALFLKRVQKRILATGKTPAELLSEKWMGEWNQDPRKLIGYLRIA
jgi:glutamate--cysteine ligase